jgi:hypothetical protein
VKSFFIIITSGKTSWTLILRNLTNFITKAKKFEESCATNEDCQYLTSILIKVFPFVGNNI